MSKPRISIYLEVDTVAHGQTIKTAIQNRLAGKDLFDVINFDSGVRSEPGKDIIFGVAEFRFNSRIDRDTLRDWIKDQVQNTNVKNWIIKAKISTHLCTHDDVEVQSCNTTEYILEYEK